jgi:2-polyprenyl-6-methoxyphenol hydroxylase-like FAD-dependent oxidoreductase
MAGVDATIIDQNPQGRGHSYAVVLHPRTVGLLADLGMTEPLLWQGRSFERVRVYSEGRERALLDVPAPNALAHGGLTLPQDVLRRALEASLHAQGIDVEYGRRFEGLSLGAESVRVRLDSPPESAGAGGGSKPDPVEITARFVIGCDGYDSSVRRALGISMVAHAPSEPYGFFDVLGERATGRDADLVIDELSAAVYPLHGGTSRYAFQLPDEAAQPVPLSELKQTRMPWSPRLAERVEWSGAHRFARATVASFGSARVWLAGDAAHTTSPLGAQSLNVGLREARDLSRTVADCMHGAPLERLTLGYGVQRELEWRRLMAVEPPSVRRDTPEWARRHLPRLIASLPASGDDLDDLLAQLGVTLP